MSFFNKIRTWWTFSQNSGHRGPRIYIIEASSLPGQRRGGRRSPAEQVQLLQRLGRFVEKEKIQVSAVLEGKPLREAKEGVVYKGVRVHYADNGVKAGDVIVKLVRKGLRGSSVTVITADRQTEKAVLAAGGTVMRAATFGKALDGVTGEKKRKPDSSQPRRPRRRSRGPRENGRDAKSKEDKTGEGRPPPAADDNDSAVRELLDLVE
jgi:predicted RNA-binding protein with PIN domain